MFLDIEGLKHKGQMIEILKLFKNNQLLLEINNNC